MTTARVIQGETELRQDRSGTSAERNRMIVRAVQDGDWSEWLRLRLALWPDDTPRGHEAGMRDWLATPDGAVFVAVRPDGTLAGFAEAGTRSYADGCHSSPVSYLEGWYVDPDLRGNGVGKALIRAVEEWARNRGHVELASDALLSNARSQRAHEALGFTEVERVVLFRKDLDGEPSS